DRTDVRVLVEAATDGDEQTPEGDVIGHAREPDRSEEDRIVLADLRDAVLRHHLPMLLVPLAAPGKLVPAELDAVLRRGGVQHANAPGPDLVADPVPGNAAAQWLANLP